MKCRIHDRTPRLISQGGITAGSDARASPDSRAGADRRPPKERLSRPGALDLILILFLIPREEESDATLPRGL